MKQAMSAQEMFWKAKFIQWMGMDLQKIENGECHTSLKVREEFLQQDGFVHAGIVTTLADHTAGGAAGSVLASDEGVLTVEFKVNFLRAAKSPVLYCESKILKKGRSIAVAESSVYSSEKKTTDDLLARATITLAVMKLGR